MTDATILDFKDAAVKGRSCKATCETSNYRAMRDLFDTCQEAALLGLVVGVPGAGKSTAISRYMEEKPDVLFFCADAASSDLHPLLYSLTQQLGLFAKQKGYKSQMFRSIVSRLRTPEHELALLLIDEGQQLTDAALLGVRGLYDAAGIGVVLVANPLLADRLGMARAGKREPIPIGFDQLTGRIGRYLEIPGVLLEDVLALCDHFGIASKDARAVVRKAAQRQGALHQVDALIRISRTAAENPDALSYSDIAAAAQLLKWKL